MKLVDDWRSWWKWHSTYFYAVLAALPEVWLSSPDLQALLPLPLVAKIAPVIALIGFFLRMRKQPSVCPPVDRHDAPPTTRQDPLP